MERLRPRGPVSDGAASCWPLAMRLAMPAVSDAPLAKKMLLKPGMKALVLGAPEGFLDALKAPEGATVATKASGKGYDFGVAFVKDRAGLAKAAPKLVQALHEDAIGWIAWPKKTSSIKTDLSRDAGWEALWETGWEGVSLVSIDEDWSAFRIRPSEKVKSSRR